MRRLTSLAAGAAFIAFPLTVYAQGMAPDTGRILSDPNFLPYAGQIYGFTDYDHTWTNGDSFNNLDAKTASFNVNTDTVGQFLSYGLMDDLELNAAIHYVPGSQRDVTFANGTQESLNSSGFGDPSFGVVWRALEQGPSPVDFDLFGSYSPDWIDSKAPSPNNDGTVARGGSSGTVGAAVGYVTPQFSLRGSFNANFYGRSDTLDLLSGDTLRTDSRTDYVLGLATQWRFNPVFSVNAGIDHTFASNQNVLNTATDVSHVGEPGDTTALHAALNYHIVPNKVVASAIYTHDFYSNAQSVYANPASDSSVRNRSGDSVGVRLYYVLP